MGKILKKSHRRLFLLIILTFFLFAYPKNLDSREPFVAFQNADSDDSDKFEREHFL